MIKITRIENENTAAAIASLRREKEKTHGTYNTPEVNRALAEVFLHKCYICEDNESTSYQIEHLHPHRENPDLKFDWNNLFWACEHCNNTKSDHYDPILDCTQDEIEQKIAFRKQGRFGEDERYVFVPLSTDEKTSNTVKLLEAVYEGTTTQKKIGAKVLKKRLRKSLANFQEYVREYDEASDGVEKEDLLMLLKYELRDASSFVAFKRWMLRDHAERYQELLSLICK